MKNQEEMRITNFFTVYRSVYPGSRIILLDFTYKTAYIFQLFRSLNNNTLPFYNTIIP